MKNRNPLHTMDTSFSFNHSFDNKPLFSKYLSVGYPIATDIKGRDTKAVNDITKVEIPYSFIITIMIVKKNNITAPIAIDLSMIFKKDSPPLQVTSDFLTTIASPSLDVQS